MRWNDILEMDWNPDIGSNWLKTTTDENFELFFERWVERRL